MRRRVPFLIAVLLVANLPGQQGVAQTVAQPNIVHIFADDLGYGAVGYTGNPLNQAVTPHIDALAAGGLTFTNGYSATVCTPSRAMLMTGMHDGHALADRNGANDVLGGTFRDEDVTVAEVLRDAGYMTGLFGKHGFGGTEGSGPLKSGIAVHDPAALPNNLGYDEFFGYLDQTRAHNYFVDELWEIDATAPDGVQTVATGNTTENPTVSYSHDQIAGRSLQFIADHATQTSPFYLQVNYTIPHDEIDHIDDAPAVTIAGEEQPAGRGQYAGNPDLSDNEERYAAMVTRMDASIGHLLARLRDPNGDGDVSDSVMENTLILFTSDNGGTSSDGTPLGSFDLNGPFRGQKGSLYEGGIHVPALAYWEGTIAAGSTSDIATDLADFLPTAAELAGGRAAVGTDGVSIAPTLTGQGIQRERDYLIFEDGTSDWAIIRDGMKLIELANETQELYDLTADPGESSPLNLNVAANGALRDELRAIAIAEGVENTGSYAVTMRTWTGGDGDTVSDAANWSGSGAPAANWSALLANTAASESTATVNINVATLGFEVRGNGLAGRQTVKVNEGITLGGRNEIRISEHGQIDLQGGTLDTVRWVDVLADGELAGYGEVTGHVYNVGGRVAPALHPNAGQGGGPPVDTGVVPAIAFDFTGVQDDAPLTQTSTLNENLILVGGLNFGPGTEPRYENVGSSDEGNEFNVSGFANPDSGNLATAISGNDYVGYTVAPISGIEILLDTVTFELRRNGDAAAQRYAVLTSIDGFTSSADLDRIFLDEGNTAQQTFSAQYSGGQWASGNVEIRLYGWDANSENGNTHLNGAALTASFRSTGPVQVDDTLVLHGDYFQLAEAKLAIDLFGSGGEGGIDYDQLTVSGEAALAGTLELTVDAGYTPTVGDQFDVVTAVSISGGFDTITGVQIDSETGLAVSTLNDRVQVTVARLGDADLDGIVNIDDFFVLRDSFGTAAGWEGGDFDGNGVVNIDDFFMLRDNFGASGASAATAVELAALDQLAAQTVPEPQALGLLGLGVVLLGSQRGLVDRKRGE